MADAGRAQLGDRVPCVRLQLVAERHQADRLRVARDEDDLQPARRRRGGLRLERAGEPAARREVTRRAELDGDAADLRRDAEAGHRLHRHRLERRRPGVPRMRGDGAIDRVRRARRHGGRGREHGARLDALDGPHVHDAEDAVRQRPRLVDRHRGDGREALEVQAALDQHAAPRRRRERRHDRDRRAQHERARAGDDQQHQRAIAARRRPPRRTPAAARWRPAPPARGPPACSARRSDRPRPATAPACAWARSTRWMMRASVVSSPIAVTRTSSAPVPLTVPAKTRSPAARATGIDSPVIGAWLTSLGAGHDVAVERDALARADGEQVADGDRRDRHALQRGAAPARHVGGRVRDQRADGVAGAIEAAPLERLRQREEHDDRRRLDPLADERGADDRDGHQHEHVEAALPHRRDGAAQRGGAAGDDGERQERHPPRPRRAQRVRRQAARQGGRADREPRHPRAGRRRPHVARFVVGEGAEPGLGDRLGNRAARRHRRVVGDEQALPHHVGRGALDAAQGAEPARRAARPRAGSTAPRRGRSIPRARRRRRTQRRGPRGLLACDATRRPRAVDAAGSWPGLFDVAAALIEQRADVRVVELVVDLAAGAAGAHDAQAAQQS